MGTRAIKFFERKEEPSMLDSDPTSYDDINKNIITQLCYDWQMDDDEIEEFVCATIEWKNKQADIYFKAELNDIISSVKSKQMEYELNSDAYNALRDIEEQLKILLD